MSCISRELAAEPISGDTPHSSLGSILHHNPGLILIQNETRFVAGVSVDPVVLRFGDLWVAKIGA